jgi:ribosome-associated toxin RatA of RatAB toxin-antitoxin module
MNYISLLFGILLFSGSVILNIFSGKIPDYQDPEEWELRKDKNDIQVYTRKYPQSNIREFKAVATLKADISQLAVILNEVENYPSWMANCKSAEIWKEIDDTTRIDYMTTAVPWPMSDRDIVFRVSTTRNTHEHFEIILTALPDAVPEKENLIRIRKSEGTWKVKKKNKDTVEVIHQFYGDPEGNVPGWIINMFIVTGPFKTLTRLRELCQAGEE